MAPGLTGVDVDTYVYRPATYIEQVTGNLRTAASSARLWLSSCCSPSCSAGARTLVTFVAASCPWGLRALILHLSGRTLDGMVTLGLAAARSRPSTTG